MANGKMYGLAVSEPVGRLTCRVEPLTSDVSRANETARLVQMLEKRVAYAMVRYSRVNSFIIVKSRMSLSSV